MSAASKLIRMVTRKKSKPKRKYKKSRTDRVRQDEGNTAADLMTPATAATPDSSGTKILVGTGEPNSRKIRESAVIANRQNDLGKELTRSMKKLEDYKNKRDSLTGKDKIKFIANKSQEIELLKSKIKNMRDDRDIVPKKKGGKIMKKNMGGPLKSVNNPGLAKLPTPVRNKMGYAKGGGKVEYKKHGGKVIKTNMSGDDVVRGCYD
jgi:hypothetical protein